MQNVKNNGTKKVELTKIKILQNSKSRLTVFYKSKTSWTWVND